MSKKKIGIVAIIVSAVVHVVLLIWQLTSALSIFSDPDKFTLVPFVWVLLILILLLGHIGLYVMIMDYEEKKEFVFAKDNWWEAWDEN